jgi:hypothetical protein
MKKIKPTFFVVILIVISVFTIGIAAEAAILQKQKNEYVQQSLYPAEITFRVYGGEGCGCIPLAGATISAYGGEGYESGVTDENGICVLTLEIYGEYRVQIEAEDYTMILFDFDVVDNQMFSFHMQEKPESSNYAGTLLHRFISKILN